MTNIPAFIAAALGMLLMPGPTNTLLLSSAAAAGVRRSIVLVAAELTGYLTSITVLALGVGPLIRLYPVLGTVMRGGAAAYLLAVAAYLWFSSSEVTKRSEPLEPHRIFVTTLLNPKALVFAFFVVPHLFDGHAAAAMPYLAGLSAMILFAGTTWIVAGALAGPSMERFAGGGAARRIGALAQVFFATILVSSIVFV